MHRFLSTTLALCLVSLAACSAPVVLPADPAGPSLPMSWRKWKGLERDERGQVTRREERPTWTCSLPPYQGLLTLGYSMPWVYPGDTLLQACERGVDHMTRTMLSRVRTESAVLTWQYWEHGWFDKEVEVPEGQDRLVAGSAVIVDIWLEPGTAAGWCLIGLPGESQPGGPPQVGDAEEESSRDVRPVWFDEPPSEKGMLYAIGTSQAWAEEWRGIENAEEDALAELSRVLSSRAEGSMLSISRDGSADIHQIRKLVSEAVLVGAQVVAWWRDSTDGAWYTLARLPVTPVKVSLAPVLAEKESPDDQGGESLLESAEAHHKKMERVMEAMEWE